MSQKYDEYLEKHRQAVKKAYQWIAAYIPYSRTDRCGGDSKY